MRSALLGRAFRPTRPDPKYGPSAAAPAQKHCWRAVQYHLPLEGEAAFFQHAPRCRIGGTDEANDPFGMQRAERSLQRRPDQFRGIAMSPTLRMKVVGQVQAVEIRRYGDTAEADQLAIGLDRPAAKAMLVPVADVTR